MAFSIVLPDQLHWTARLTMHLGEPPQRQVIPVGGIVHVQAGTPLQTVNEGDEDLVAYAYGSPPDEGAEVLPPAA